MYLKRMRIDNNKIVRDWEEGSDRGGIRALRGNYTQTVPSVADRHSTYTGTSHRKTTLVDSRQ